MIVSLNPTYYCNFRCSFCYLGDMLSDQTTITLERLNALFAEIIGSGETIDGIELYGGEISQLPDHYVEEMFKVIRLYFDGDISLITNMSRVPDYFYNEDLIVTASWDYKAREKWQEVYNNIANFPKPMDVLILASQNVIKYKPEEIIHMLNALPNLASVEIKPYSTNKYNEQPVSFKDFEEFVKGFFNSPEQLNAEFKNESLIQESLSGNRNAFSDDHIYITPNGKFGVLEFDSQDREFFLELDTFQEYIEWTKKEKLDTYMNGYCSSCEYFGSCLSEHLREVKDISKSCNGFKGLLDWYKEK